MLDFRVAQKMLVSLAKSFGREQVPVSSALGRVLAEDVFADRDYPPFNRATMDGYALTLTDLESGARDFDVIEIIFAGQAPEKKLSRNCCYKIMTGAAVPPDADIVIRREDVEEEGSMVTILINEFRRFANIAKKGEDTKESDGVLKAPMTCTPAVISVLAAMGKTNVWVERLPRVSVFTTGNEIREPGEAVNAFQIRNSNRFLLDAMLKKWDIIPVQQAHIADDRLLLEEAFTAALTSDIILVSGAVSAGDADFVPGVMEKIGVKKIFHKLSIKPGKPIWCGRHDNGCVVFALPGNPFSSLVTFILIAETYLRVSLGAGEGRKLRLPVAAKRTKKSALDEFFPVRIEGDPLAAMSVNFNSSGDILAAIYADGLAHHPASVPVLEAGSVIDVWLLNRQ